MSATSPVYTDFEPNPDDNQASPPLGAPEGSYQGRHVNDTFRVVMAAIRNLGDAALLLSSGVYTAASTRISSLADATVRSDAINLGQVQDGAGIWCGTSTGTANAQVLTPSPALTGGYRAGQLFRGVWGFTNTSAMSVTVSGQGEVSVRSLYGNALSGGEAQVGRRFTIEHDGSVFRMLEPAGRMDQLLYDLMFPVGFVQIKDNTTTPSVPLGVTATWTRITTDAYFRIATGTPGTGGELTTGGSGTLTSGGPSNTVAAGEGGGTAGGLGHTHDISSHTHSIEPTYRSFSVWERTA